jgi:hypothetical protein
MQLKYKQEFRCVAAYHQADQEFMSARSDSCSLLLLSCVFIKCLEMLDGKHQKLSEQLFLVTYKRNRGRATKW